jgi:hypothetical protein
MKAAYGRSHCNPSYLGGLGRRIAVQVWAGKNAKNLSEE